MLMHQASLSNTFYRSMTCKCQNNYTDLVVSNAALEWSAVSEPYTSGLARIILSILCHLAAVYFIGVHKFDYNFKKFWKREPPKGIMWPFMMDGQIPTLSRTRYRLNLHKKNDRTNSLIFCTYHVGACIFFNVICISMHDLNFNFPCMI